MNKIYTSQGVGIAALLGGPLGAGFLLSKNFKSFGFYQHSKNSIWISFLALIVTFTILFMIPENIPKNIPNFLFPLIYYGIAYWISDKYLKSNIENHKSSRGLVHSNWRAAGIGLVFAIVTL